MRHSFYFPVLRKKGKSLFCFYRKPSRGGRMPRRIECTTQFLMKIHFLKDSAYSLRINLTNGTDGKTCLSWVEPFVTVCYSYPKPTRPMSAIIITMLPIKLQILIFTSMDCLAHNLQTN